MKNSIGRRICTLLLALLLLSAQLPAAGFAEEGEGYRLSNEYFDVRIGEYGQIESLKIVGDEFPTNYVMNAENSPGQDTSGHEWMGELMFKTKAGDAAEWTEALTQSSGSGRTITRDGNKVIVIYENANETRGIKDFKLVETYSLAGDKLQWDIKIINTGSEKLTVGDLGLPMPFNERWPGGEQIYETRVVDHSFVAKDSSYIYATRPSGIGKFLLLTPDPSTGAGFEYQDHWRTSERRSEESAWCQDQAGWANGLNVFYIHSDVIKSTNRGYLENTSLELAAGGEKTYTFKFSAADDERDMKSTLYEEGLIDAVAVPGMAFSKNMPSKMYLHTRVPQDEISLEIQCPHETGLHEGNPRTVSNNMDHTKTEENTYINYVETKIIGDEQYYIYNLKFEELGQHNVIANYTGGKQTVLQFYIMDPVEDALELHSDFMVEKTQWDEPNALYDKAFDDWMMDTKAKRGEFYGYWGWGDDWGLTHGEYLAEKNVYQPVTDQIKAVDEYLDVAIWNGLMREHQEDYLIHDFLMPEPNTTPIYRGYAYPHIYNTYFSMYKIASRYPDMIEYQEEADTYLLRAYNVLRALYSDDVAYNWATGLMGEMTTPEIIEALNREGHYEEAENVMEIMDEKYDSFKNTTYPYGSEYSYDNTGEEAVYTLAKLHNAADTENSNRMMSAIDAKTRACRGLQPIWYHYANPTTNCGENWWNFQYTASLAGHCMDDWLRLQDNSYTAEESALAARVNYAAKLANLTAINSGQIDSDPENIGTVAWTYQSEMGNLGGQGTGGGKLHNGWRQMAGEADLGLFGAMRILSADVTVDPVFGLFGYGCNIIDSGDEYQVTPLDGLHTRLNFINEKLYIELDRDQYTQATISKNKTSITLNIKNLEGTEHSSDLEVTGLQPGSYQISVDGSVTGSFLARDGKTALVRVKLPAADTSVVELAAGTLLPNTAPAVEAGDDPNTHISDHFRLEGEASDDGQPDMTIIYSWTLESAPEGGDAIIKNPGKPVTEVGFTKAGTYVFRLTANDGELSGSDTVSVTVEEDLPLPNELANYTFKKIDADKKLVLDETGRGYNARLVGNPTITTGDALLIADKAGSGYVKLPPEITGRVTEATIAIDFNLYGVQRNGARLYEFGDMDGNYFYVSFRNGNTLVLGVTDLSTGETREVDTGVKIAQGYQKNIAVTLKDGLVVLYVDGIRKAALENCGFSFAGLGEVQRNYIGRSWNENSPQLNGAIDNFLMKSAAMTENEILEAFGSAEERTIVSGDGGSVVTTAGVAPILPDTVSVLYSDGIYAQEKVEWDPIPEENYAEKGEFTVGGTLEGTEVTVTIKVIVADGWIQNLAIYAVPTAIINTPEDLGGVTKMNDGFEPARSSDTSHGVWHNWNGNQSGPAWVQYTWEDDEILTGMDAYYFKDGGGNFAPASVGVQYLNDEGEWCPVTNAIGLGVELNQFNDTSFDPIKTKAVRMILQPATLGCGVIEWKVYGYSDRAVVDKNELNTVISIADGLKQAAFVTNLSAISDELASAKAVQADSYATQEDIDGAAQALSDAVSVLEPVDGNLAYLAVPFSDYTASWEKITMVNNPANLPKSSSPGAGRGWGNWGCPGGTGSTHYIQYTWCDAVDIGGVEIYWYDDGGGTRVPQSISFQYQDMDGSWHDAEMITDFNDAGELNQFNTIEIVPVTAKALKMNCVLSESGTGILRWNVYSPSDEPVVNKTALRAKILDASGYEEEYYTEESWEAFEAALAVANNVNDNNNATQEEVDDALEGLTTAIENLKLIPDEREAELILHLALDGDTADSSPNGYSGELPGTGDPGIIWVEGIDGEAVNFTGEDTWLDIPAGNGLLQPEITISYWIKRTGILTGNNALLWAKEDSAWNGNGFYLNYPVDGNYSSFFIIDGFNGFYVDEDPNTFLPLNEWTHIAITWNSVINKGAIYKNGIAQDIEIEGEPDLISAPAGGTAVNRLGKNGYPSDPQYPAGLQLDDLRIYDNDMPPEEIEELYEEFGTPETDKVEEPVAEPAPGTYNSARKVTLTCTTTEAAIYYTLDGSVPTTESALYIEPIHISESTTIKAIATKAGMADSDVAAFRYIIKRSGGRDDGEPSGSSAPPVEIEVKPDGMAVIRKKQTVENDSVISDITAADMDKALRKAKADENGLKTVLIELKRASNINRYVQKLPPGNLSSAAANTNIQIITPVAGLTIPSNMFRQEDTKDKKTVELAVERVDNKRLDEEVQKQIGDRPVIGLYAVLDGERVEWNNPSAPVKIEIDYKPTAEELKNPENIVVYYIDGNNNLIAVPNGRYDPETGKVTFTVTHFSHYAISYSVKSFGDLALSAWAQKAIGVMAAKGIVEGTSANEFSPQKAVTRGEALAWLVRTLGLSAGESGNFDDVSGGRYAKEIGIAGALGITNGVGNNKFEPERPIARQDLMTLIDRALNIIKQGLERGAGDDIAKFADAPMISEYAMDSVAALVKSRIIVGSGSHIHPKGDTARAEAAMIMYRLYNR